MNTFNCFIKNKDSTTKKPELSFSRQIRQNIKKPLTSNEVRGKGN